MAGDRGCGDSAAAAIAGVTRYCTPMAGPRARPWPKMSPLRCWPGGWLQPASCFPATAPGKNIAPRVAAQLDAGQLSDVIKVVSLDTFERPIYAGNAIANVREPDPVKVIHRAGATASTPRPPAGGIGHSRDGRAGRRFRQDQLRGPRSARTTDPSSRLPSHLSGGRALGSSDRVQRGADYRSPTSSVRRSAPAARPSMRATRPTTGKSGRPARSSRRSCTLRSASVAPSSTWPLTSQGDRGRQQGPPKRRSSALPTTASSRICSSPSRNWSRRFDASRMQDLPVGHVIGRRAFFRRTGILAHARRSEQMQ